MAAVRWVDYSGAAPILLPVRLLPHWQGFYLPATADDDVDLELASGSFVMCTDFDFKHPKTDYDRACALSSNPAVQALPVGPGHGLVFATELDSLTWWAAERMLVNGRPFPKPAGLARVEWSDELVWRTSDREYVLMNACEHGSDPRKRNYFRVRLDPGTYTVQWGQHGWEDDDPVLYLFRFVRSA